MIEHYILDGKEVKSAEFLEWSEWFGSADRNVAKDQIGDKNVSTVFLGLDHSFGDGPPLLFETMVFPVGSYDEEYCDRCSTWKEAEQMHKKACAMVRRKQGNGTQKTG